MPSKAMGGIPYRRNYSVAVAFRVLRIVLGSDGVGRCCHGAQSWNFGLLDFAIIFGSRARGAVVGLLSADNDRQGQQSEARRQAEISRGVRNLPVGSTKPERRTLAVP